jgi:hypothetical protein
VSGISSDKLHLNLDKFHPRAKADLSWICDQSPIEDFPGSWWENRFSKVSGAMHLNGTILCNIT